MRRLVALLSLCALSLAQLPTTACAAPHADAATHHDDAANGHGAHHGGADTAEPGTPAGTPADGRCTMLTPCHWIVMLAPGTGWTRLRTETFAHAGQLAAASITADPNATTPPPRLLS